MSLSNQYRGISSYKMNYTIFLRFNHLFDLGIVPTVWYFLIFYFIVNIELYRGRRGHDGMEVEFTNYLTLWVRIPLRRYVLHTTFSDHVCQWHATCWWFSPGTPVSSTNKTDRHDITEILLKVALNAIAITLFIEL